MNDTTNSKTMNTTTFGAAIEAAKDGQKITRSGWNGKWLIMFSHSTFITVDSNDGEEVPSNISEVGWSCHIGDEGTRIEHIGITETGDEFYPISDFLLMKTADNKVVPWLASQTDVLAEDWLILPR